MDSSRAPARELSHPEAGLPEKMQEQAGGHYYGPGLQTRLQRKCSPFYFQVQDERVWNEQDPGEAMENSLESCVMGWIKANDVGWPTFNENFVNYCHLEKEMWPIFVPTMTCVNEDMRKMIENIESLAEIWETVVTCYARLEKYIAEALKPVVEFRKY